MNDNLYAVIMAGGGGTRLWPLSIKRRPKQLIKFDGENSLFSIAIQRLAGLIKWENIFVVTIADQVEALRKEVPELSADHYIIEPQPKGTASVVGLAAVKLLNLNKNAVMAILTADHIIENIPLFHSLLRSAFVLAEKNHLVTLGIKPTNPATGYGYIKTGEMLRGIQGAYQVERFVEKPDEITAKAYLSEGNYFWNSGMFVWQAKRILQEFQVQMPGLYQKLERISTLLKEKDFREEFAEIWGSIVPETIDYGIMENAGDVVMLRAEELKWNDVGCWDSLFEFLQVNENGNVVKTKNSAIIDTSNVLILGENDKKIISTLGIEDLVIIDTENALLVCKKGETQRIKQLIETMKEAKQQKFL